MQLHAIQNLFTTQLISIGANSRLTLVPDKELSQKMLTLLFPLTWGVLVQSNETLCPSWVYHSVFSV